MIRRLLVNEIIKAARQKVTYLGIFFALLPPVLWTKVVRAFGEEENLNGFLFIATAIQASVTGIIPVFLILFSSILVAGEATTGTMRLILSRPVSRFQFLMAKMITALGYVALLLGLSFAISFLIGWLKYGFSIPEDVASLGVGATALWWYMCVSLFFSFIPLAGVAIYGFSISVLTRNVGTAVAFSVGIFIGIQSVKHLITFGDYSLNDFWFASYTEVAFARMIDIIGGYSIAFLSDKIYISVGLTVITSVMMMMTAFVVFQRRDLNY